MARVFQVFAFFALPMAAVWLYNICDEMIALFTVGQRAPGARWRPGWHRF